MKHAKPSMGICLKCRQVRVLTGALCRDCRDAAQPKPPSPAPRPN